MIINEVKKQITYEDIIKKIYDTYGSAGVTAYELCLDLFEQETGINAHNLKGKLVFTLYDKGPVPAKNVANTKPATYIKMIESGEISALKLLMKYYYNMVGDPKLNVNRLKKESIDNSIRHKGGNSMIKKIQINENQVDEARQMHTWNITYTGKGNKAKTHMVDAPDAYEANRKARRELGISYSDIDDVTMVENKEVVNETYMIQKDDGQYYIVDEDDNIESGPYSTEEEAQERVDKLNESLFLHKHIKETYNDSYYTSVKEEVRDFLEDEISDEVETFVYNLMDKFPVQLIASEVPSYNMDWCKEEFDTDDWYKLQDVITKKITYLILTELFYNT